MSDPLETREPRGPWLRLSPWAWLGRVGVAILFLVLASRLDRSGLSLLLALLLVLSAAILVVQPVVDHITRTQGLRRRR